MSASKASAVQFAKSYDGANVAYVDHGGSGRPIVFLPGWCCTQKQWTTVVELLGMGVRAITLDYAGFGASGGHQRQWAIENFARDARAVIDALDLTNVLVVGHSMGGAVALELAYLSPERVSRVIGADTFTYPVFYSRFDERHIDLTMAGLRENFAATVAPMLSAYFLPGTSDAFVASICEEIAAADPYAGASSMEHFLRWDVGSSLAKCPCPVSTINSENLLDRVAADMLGIPVRTIPNVGHFLMREQPQFFVQSLRAEID